MLLEPAVLAFPLRGEWRALNSPADKVPSHGTDFFAQRYAIDFFQVGPGGEAAHADSTWRQFLATVPAYAFYCWNAPVLAAAAGVIVAVGDGHPDRPRVNAFYEMARAFVLPPRASPDEFRPLAGNYVILESSSGYLLYAHLRLGSIRVGVGDVVEAREEVARVGNSGNTTMPHLHFQRMSTPDPFTAEGLPMLFEGLQVESDGKWVRAEPMMPGRNDRFRTEPEHA